MEFKTYLFTYNFEGAKWDFPVKAKTPEEARERLNRMLYAEYTGEVIASIPASSANLISRMLSVIARFFGLYRNR